MGLRVGEGSGHVRSGEDKSVAEIYPVPRPGLLRRAVDVNGERLEVGVGGLRPRPGRRESRRLEIDGMEERADRLGQSVPTAAQKRRKEAIETEDFNQRRKKDIKECVSSRRPHSDLITHDVVVGYSLNIG